MDVKLTLKLDQQVIEQAKRFATEKRLSLSRLVENYLQSLVSGTQSDEIRISPFVKSMSGKVDIPADLDYRAEYREYLNGKHQ